MDSSQSDQERKRKHEEDSETAAAADVAAAAAEVAPAKAMRTEYPCYTINKVQFDFYPQNVEPSKDGSAQWSFETLKKVFTAFGIRAKFVSQVNDDDDKEEDFAPPDLLSVMFYVAVGGKRSSDDRINESSVVQDCINNIIEQAGLYIDTEENDFARSIPGVFSADVIKDKFDDSIVLLLCKERPDCHAREFLVPLFPDDTDKLGYSLSLMPGHVEWTHLNGYIIKPVPKEQKEFLTRHTSVFDPKIHCAACLVDFELFGSETGGVQSPREPCQNTKCWTTKIPRLGSDDTGPFMFHPQCMKRSPVDFGGTKMKVNLCCICANTIHDCCNNDGCDNPEECLAMLRFEQMYSPFTSECTMSPMVDLAFLPTKTAREHTPDGLFVTRANIVAPLMPCCCPMHIQMAAIVQEADADEPRATAVQYDGQGLFEAEMKLYKEVQRAPRADQDDKETEKDEGLYRAAIIRLSCNEDDTVVDTELIWKF